MYPLQLYQAIDSIADHLAEQGVELSEAVKRRDPREPGRAIKERWEDRLTKLMKRYFRGQKKRLSEHLAGRLAVRVMTFKAKADDIMGEIPDSVWRDEATESLLLRLFIAAGTDGVDLFRASVPIGINYEQVNTQAARWARRYVTQELFSLMDTTTRKRVREAVAAFVETPGMTIGDVIEMLSRSFSADRALTVAVTEITRVFSQADELAARQLKKEFPDVLIVKTWFTNRDDRVCPVCQPLNENYVYIGNKFDTKNGLLDGPPAHSRCRCWRSTRTVIAAGDIDG